METGDHIESDTTVRHGLIREAFHDDEIRHAVVALGRTVINTAITALDFVPVIGEAASWSADLGKFTKRFNLTPDVSKFTAIGSEVFEFTAAGAMPTHAIESVLQLSHDTKRIKSGWQRWKQLKSSPRIKD